MDLRLKDQSSFSNLKSRVWNSRHKLEFPTSSGCSHQAVCCCCWRMAIAQAPYTESSLWGARLLSGHRLWRNRCFLFPLSGPLVRMAVGSWAWCLGRWQNSVVPDQFHFQKVVSILSLIPFYAFSGVIRLFTMTFMVSSSFDALHVSLTHWDEIFIPGGAS